jgi:hypothetical protein
VNTIAQMWKEFVDHTYGERLARKPELELEYRMLFFTGFKACIRCMALIAEADLSKAEMTARVTEYMDEYERFARGYIEQRIRES